MSPAFISITLPPSIAAVARPESTIPTCSTSQLFLPRAWPTWTDHFHPGEYVARPIVIPPMWINSNLPLSKFRTSSGRSKCFRITSSMFVPPSGQRSCYPYRIILSDDVKLYRLRRKGQPPTHNWHRGLGEAHYTHGQLGITMSQRRT